MTTSDMEAVERHIADWTYARKSNISLRTFAWEIAAIRTATGVEHFGSVLEVGCGSGIFLITCVALGLAERGVGIDPTITEHGTAQSEMAEGEALVKRLGLNVRLENRSLEALLDEDGDGQDTYDLVVFRGSLHHIYERDSISTVDQGVIERCVKDLAAVRRRFLRDGGHLWILELTRPGAFYSGLYNLYKRGKGQGPFDWGAKRTGDEWTEILVAAGMQRVQVMRMPVNKLIGTPLENNIGMMLSNVTLLAAAS